MLMAVTVFVFMIVVLAMVMMPVVVMIVPVFMMVMLVIMPRGVRIDFPVQGRRCLHKDIPTVLSYLR